MIIEFYFLYNSQVFIGNIDRDSIVRNQLRNDVQAKYVRFYPEEYNDWPCLRVEIYVRK